MAPAFHFGKFFDLTGLLAPGPVEKQGISASSLRVLPKIFGLWIRYNSAVLQTIRECLPRVDGYKLSFVHLPALERLSSQFGEPKGGQKNTATLAAKSIEVRIS
jgi:hypothetical protein